MMDSHSTPLQDAEQEHEFIQDRAPTRTSFSRFVRYRSAIGASIFSGRMFLPMYANEVVAQEEHRRVWLWKKTEFQSYCWHLIVRREIGSRNEIKYSNAAADVPRQQLAYLQGQRY